MAFLEGAQDGEAGSYLACGIGRGSDELGDVHLCSTALEMDASEPRANMWVLWSVGLASGNGGTHSRGCRLPCQDLPAAFLDLSATALCLQVLGALHHVRVGTDIPYSWSAVEL